LLVKKVTENSVANPLATQLTFDQLACKFENIGGGRDAPIGTSLSVVDEFYYDGCVLFNRSELLEKAFKSQLTLFLCSPRTKLLSYIVYSVFMF